VTTDPEVLPLPALVVLVGPSGSGKTTWAKSRFARGEIVSSDALRGIVGTGDRDLDASVDAFVVLDAIVAARARRRLTTVVDTLGLDRAKRLGWIEVAKRVGLRAVAVRFDTDAATCRQRNRARDVPVPADVLTAQLRRTAEVDLGADGFDLVLPADAAPETAYAPGAVAAQAAQRDRPTGLQFALQVSRFPWGKEPREWMVSIARAAEEAGFSGLAVMDHLLQIPQVGRAWEPLPEAFTTLGFLAGVTDQLELGALVTPVTFRSAPLVAKIVATLDVLSGGRAFCGLGAGWYDREHAAYDLAFPPPRERLDRLEQTIGVLRAMWGAGTKPYAGLPETTAYPRPQHDVRILVGGNGERRTLEIAARLADGCNLPSALPVLERKVEVLRAHCLRAGRDPAELTITVLDLPVIGRDPDEVARLVERLRGRQTAAAYASAHHAGTIEDHIGRYRLLAERGVQTVFVALPDLSGPDEIERMQPVVEAFHLTTG
jgi:alkanesulfonate monooxygenase SsuD/methylene tetrahydromethanopterin reductase-like flavin-dependent oxidoreductase (luciferase family)/predicted kinase